MPDHGLINCTWAEAADGTIVCTRCGVPNRTRRARNCGLAPVRLARAALPPGVLPKQPSPGPPVPPAAPRNSLAEDIATYLTAGLATQPAEAIAARLAICRRPCPEWTALESSPCRLYCKGCHKSREWFYRLVGAFGRRPCPEWPQDAPGSLRIDTAD